MKRLSAVLHFHKTPLLYFQYISHRVLRWTITPFLLILIFILNIVLAMQPGLFYKLLLLAQVCFYIAAISGYLLENKKIRLKPLFIPYYFCVMHYAVLAGLGRFLFGKTKSGAWEKAQRKAI